MIILDAKNILLMVIVLINLALGLLIYLKGRRLKINLFYGLNIIFIIGWVLSMILYRSASAETSLFWCTVLYISPTFIASSFLYFTYIFPSQIEKIAWFKKLLIFLGNAIVVFLLIIPGFIIKDVILHPNIEKEIVFASGYIFYAIYIASYFSYGFWRLFKKYRISQGIQKHQITYLLSGYAIATNLAFVTNLFMPWFGRFELNWFGQVFTLFMVGFTVMAILKYHLFEIRVILTEILVLTIAVLLLIQFLGSENTFEYVWQGSLLVFFLVFGYFLIRSVLQEIQRRAELQKLYEQVEKLSKSKSEFISIASHQLRTPLSVTKGYISLILEGTYDKISSKLKKPLQNIYSSNERLIKLINDLLDVSRIESGKIEMDFEQVSLKEFSELVSSVVEEFKLPAKKQKLSLTWFKPARKMPQKLVNVDRNKIRQVIANFIDNAIKYTKQGGITVRMKILPSAIRIEIEDTGAGMKKGEIESLFKSFARGSVGVRVATEGLGLGLYVARMFAEMHNGRVWAESEGKDKGSSFYLELPFI